MIINQYAHCTVCTINDTDIITDPTRFHRDLANGCIIIIIMYPLLISADKTEMPVLHGPVILVRFHC
jgi:hypothetical protein